MINVTDYIDIAEKVRVTFIDGAYTGGGNPTITASPVGRFRLSVDLFFFFVPTPYLAYLSPWLSMKRMMPSSTSSFRSR